MKVYLLQHSYEYEIDQNIKIEETKIIGIYGTESKAKQVKKSFMTKKGFNRFPEDCFYIDEYEIDRDHWTEGFITWNGEKDEWIE
ncbi:DUF7336 domain-containing protein [Candidatus Enterococcus murrayae]|uniref:DUF7336 domain-containing protein n=1 Tax=Candidatus Enterococcus murrayae TaxID=2815321 RepID=A0ABS3HKS9_9ENTE|nr:hypothetical protein [Enterococcus sp. MJM16]MBO0453183.1 hypothetical protein [Enterococcus sp. MJM16]